MATVQAGSNPSARIAAGEHILEAAKSVATKPIKAKLDAFRAAHVAYVKAHASTEKAEASLAGGEAKVGDADGVQDALVRTLAAKMIGDGAPKANPFKMFGLPPPTTVVPMAVEKEVTVTKALAARASKWAAASKETKAVAAKLGAASAAVSKAIGQLGALRKGRSAAIAQRDALGVAWVRALAQLKNAARAAEDDGAAGLFAALFEVSKPAPRKRAKAKPPSQPPTPPAASPKT